MFYVKIRPRSGDKRQFRYSWKSTWKARARSIWWRSWHLRVLLSTMLSSPRNKKYTVSTLSSPSYKSISLSFSAILLRSVFLDNYHLNYIEFYMNLFLRIWAFKSYKFRIKIFLLKWVSSVSNFWQRKSRISGTPASTFTRAWTRNIVTVSSTTSAR